MPSFIAGLFLKMRPPEVEPTNSNTGEADFLPEDEVDKDLSLREWEVLNLVADGLSNNKIARRLDISEQTVKNHAASILRKMNVENRIEVAIVFQHTYLTISFENPNFTLAEFHDRLLQTAQNKEAWVFGLAQQAQERFRLDEQLKTKAYLPEEVGGGKGHLSKRELEVLGLVSQGLFNKEIARKLEISISTVRNHITSILRKLKVNDRTEAVLVFQRAIFSCLIERLHFTPEEFQDRLFQTARGGDWGLSEIFSRLEEQIETKKQWLRRKKRRVILLGIAEGRADVEIAKDLGISKQNLQATISYLYKEFGIDGKDPLRRKLLIEKATETGFLD